MQPEQRQAVSDALAREGLGRVSLAPMVRGRLIALNGKPVGPDDYEEPRAKRLVDREFNLSYGDELPSSNRIEQGRWLAPGADEVSLESGLAKTLGIKLGDKMLFDVAGQQVEAAVTSIRRVDWDTMRVNFFAILTPAALADMPQSWITSFYLPPGKEPVLPALVREFPPDRVRRGRHSAATAIGAERSGARGAAAVPVHAGGRRAGAGRRADRHARRTHARGRRAAGAGRDPAPAGALAAHRAVGGGRAGRAAGGRRRQRDCLVLSTLVFDFAITLSLWPWLAGIGAGMLGAWGGGALALRGVLRTPPLVTLRET